MLNKYKNGFIELLPSHGYVPDDFNVRDLDDGAIFRLELAGTPFLFETKQGEDSYHSFQFRHTKFAPGLPLSAWLPVDGTVNIRGIYSSFEHWLKVHLKYYFKEREIPDLWQQLQNNETLVTGKEIVDNDFLSFTVDEKTQLRLSIEEFKILIVKQFDPSEDEKHIIENRLTYLSESLDRLNKFDWKAVAINTVISISIALTLDPEKGKILFTFFKQVFSGLLKLAQ